MQYPSPAPTDFANVHALNAAYLQAGRLCGELPELNKFRQTQLDRLSRVPYLLFALQSEDAALWQRIFDATTDLADNAQASAEVWTQLTAGTLAFLWSTARKDRHSARLFSGCSDAWCAQLARRRLICVTNRMVQAGVRPVRRFDTGSVCGQALLNAGAADSRPHRDAAILGLFQSLTLVREDATELASAACRVRSAVRTQR